MSRHLIQAKNGDRHCRADGEGEKPELLLKGEWREKTAPFRLEYS